MREVIDFCTEQPEIRSWLDYFDDPTEEEALAAGSGELEGGQGAAFGGVGGVEDKDIARQVKSTTAPKSKDTGERIVVYKWRDAAAIEQTTAQKTVEHVKRPSNPLIFNTS